MSLMSPTWGQPSSVTTSAFGSPSYGNAGTIGDFLRNQLAERAKRRQAQQVQRPAQYPAGMGGVASLFGGANGS